MRISDWSSDVCSSDLEIKMCRERIAIAGSFISGERLSSSLLSRFRGWIAAERARIMMAALKSRDWDMAWQEAQEGLKVSTSGFLVFLLRDRKSTRRTPVTNAHLVCRLLLEKKK